MQRQGHWPRDWQSLNSTIVADDAAPDAATMTSTTGPDRGAASVFLIFLKLGLTSFGGPVAHLGYFHAEFVTRRRWLSDRSYADVVALCQFLPGPASSQVGMAIGLARAGYAGALAAWLGFTLPSAIALVLFAAGLAAFGSAVPPGVLHGLMVVAVAVVAQAVWGMARASCPDAPRIALMLSAATGVLLLPSAGTQVAILIAAALVGLALPRGEGVREHEPLPIRVPRRTAIGWLGLFVALLVGLPLLAATFQNPALARAAAFYRAGSIVFGGGHVVLPLLQAAVVPPGWVSNESFLTGYGAAQAVPGPLFSFAAFLGASMRGSPSGATGAALCLVAIYAPSILLVLGALPFWEGLRRSVRVQAALAGVNAAVVGLLLAALYRPVGTSAIVTPADLGLALVALAALAVWKVPPWVVVLGSGIAGGCLGDFA